MPGGGGSDGERDSPDPHPPSGVVELREDVPLKGVGSAEARCCAGGPRYILACFASLSVAITIALLTQIYYGDYEVVPHGSVSSSAAQCSRAGTGALQAGGRALDAAAAAALCLAVLAPHRSSLDASGSMLYWEYRQSHTQSPELFEWGGPDSGAGGAGGAAGGDRPPRLVAALAALHAQLGVLPWSRILQPAIDLASSGFPVSDGPAIAKSVKTDSAAAPAAMPVVVAGTLTSTPGHLAAYLVSLQANTSAELSIAWQAAALVHRSGAQESSAGGTGRGWRALAGGSGPGWRALAGGAGRGWRALAGGAGAPQVLRALSAALDPPPMDADQASRRVIEALQHEAAVASGEWPPSPTGVATGLAVIDQLDTYVALATGTSVPFGSGPETPAGWIRDEPTAPLDLAPAIVVDGHICGTRYVVGAESSSALAQGVAALTAGGAAATAVAASLERARVVVAPDGALLLEPGRPLPPAAALPAGAAAAVPALNATPPFAAVNVVQQRSDDLVSHADSRGGGLSWRF